MGTKQLSFTEYLHYRHRFLRYRFRTEPDTIQFIKEEIAIGDTALDIGANKGIVTYYLAKQTGRNGQVIAFEPQPEMNGLITRMARSFGLKNIDIHSLGLSNTKGLASLYRGGAGKTANFVSASQWQTETLDVPVTTLDEFVAAHSLHRVDFIKCDVDGFEGEVLRGAQTTLKNYCPKLLLEISSSKQADVSELLKDYGYDDGTFLYRGKRYPAEMNHAVPFRHKNSRWRNFLFCMKKAL